MKFQKYWHKLYFMTAYYVWSRADNENLADIK